MQESEKIGNFFTSHCDDESFWDYMAESHPYEYEWWEDGEDDEFEDGYNLAVTTKNRPVYVHTSKDCDTCGSRYGSNRLYFIGTEDEILAKLKDGWDSWKEKYPTGTEEDKQRTRINQERKKLEDKLQQVQVQLDYLTKQGEELENN